MTASKNFYPLFFLLFIILSSILPAQDGLPECEWCGTSEAPADLSWEAVITSDEPGEPMVISGIVYTPDKQTPAPGIILYVYHTNREGIYPKKGDETGNGKRHGYLRSWMQTNEEGKFRFTTIRPGSYPNTRAPQHVHMTLKEPGRDEYYLKTIFFADDPFITKHEYDTGAVITLEKDSSGRWIGEHTIVLKE